MKITFIGGGNMATALIGGMLAQGFEPADLTVIEPSGDKRAELQASFGVHTQTVLADGLPACDVILLAVKPQSMKEVAGELAGRIGGQLVISIAAGIQVSSLASWLGGHDNIVRVMPNTPALVRAGMSGLFAPAAVSEASRAVAERILKAVGDTLWLTDEGMMDAVTAVSGSGPAYVFYFIESLMEGAAKLGFNRADAKQLAYATFNGAVKLALDSQDDAATLRTKVTSKGGTTEAALKQMEAAQVKAGIVAGIEAANTRGQELGKELGRQ